MLMYKEKVGIVTEQEKDIVEKLYERNKSLDELLIALDYLDISTEEKSDSYKKIISDKAKTELEFNGWWNDMSQKYKWMSTENGTWVIDFNTKEIFLRRSNDL